MLATYKNQNEQNCHIDVDNERLKMENENSHLSMTFWIIFRLKKNYFWTRLNLHTYISFSSKLLITWLPLASGWSCLLQSINIGKEFFCTTGSDNIVYKYLQINKNDIYLSDLSTRLSATNELYFVCFKQSVKQKRLFHKTLPDPIESMDFINW